MTQHNFSSNLPETFLKRLVAELDSDEVTAIVLHGSYVRGEALAPYSDVDMVRILKDIPETFEQKQYTYRNGYLISIGSRPLSLYRKRFAMPEKAIFIVPGVREARILLDKDGAFHLLQQEAWNWRWEPLQAAANAYTSRLMMELTEIVLKLVRAIISRDRVALSEMMLDVYSMVTEAVAVQRGILIHSGNTYFHQVQDTIGQDSRWTSYHLLTAGISPQSSLSPTLEERGVAVLHLYTETAHLLQPYIFPEHMETITQSLRVIARALPDEKFL